LYRSTNYQVDFKDPKGKNYAARFDAVGRLQDISNAQELTRASGKEAHGAKIDDANALKKASEYVKRELPEAQVDSLYQAEQGQGFWYVQLKNGGEVILNEQGQIYSLREPIANEDLPEPIAASVKDMFTAPIDKLWRSEQEYYQFNETTQRKTPIVVKMRPNGDIMEVRNMEAIQAEQAQQAKSKQKG
jgi:hypothetical protein